MLMIRMLRMPPSNLQKRRRRPMGDRSGEDSRCGGGGGSGGTRRSWEARAATCSPSIFRVDKLPAITLVSANGSPGRAIISNADLACKKELFGCMGSGAAIALGHEFALPMFDDREPYDD